MYRLSGVAVGAGDCFLAGLVTALLAQSEPLDALSVAGGQAVLSNALASATLCVMRRGCAPPTHIEVLDRCARFTPVLAFQPALD